MTPYILSLIMWYSTVNGLDPYLVAGVIQKESSFNTKAVGGIGEKGLMQLRPEFFEGPEDKDLYPVKIGRLYLWEKGTILEKTRKKNSHSLFNPETNIATGTKYLRKLQSICPYKGKFELLVCYNRGPSGAKRVKNPQEDKYVKAVIANAQNLYNRNIFDQLNVSMVWR